MHLRPVLMLVLGLCGCPSPRTEAPLPAAPTAPVDKPPSEHGPSLEFVLDPLDRNFEHQAESEALRGKRSIVLVFATYDVGSLLALRNLAPLFNDLPKDAACLQVAMQPLGDRELVGAFLDAEKTPCRKAIGDVKRGRMGDLAQVKVLPTAIVLRADGTVVGTVVGTIEADAVKKLLDRAK